MDLSVVIPTIGQNPVLTQVLARLARQAISSDRYEVILAVDARAEFSEAFSASLESQPLQMSVAIAERAGASAARNLGVARAKAPVVLFLGDDILPSPRLLAEHVAWHHRNSAIEVGVLGHVRWSRQLAVSPFMRWLEQGVQFDFASIDGTEASWAHFYTANVSVKRELIRRVHGFDEFRLPYLYEDLDLAYRMASHGFRLLYNRRAIGWHHHPTNLAKWRGRMVLTAEAERAFVDKHPELDPYFYRLFSAATSREPARGRGRHFLRIIPRRTPWIGEKVWTSADLFYGQKLAPAFLQAWRNDESGYASESNAASPDATRSGGSPPGGPK